MKKKIASGRIDPLLSTNSIDALNSNIHSEDMIYFSYKKTIGLRRSVQLCRSKLEKTVVLEITYTT